MWWLGDGLWHCFTFISISKHLFLCLSQSGVLALCVIIQALISLLAPEKSVPVEHVSKMKHTCMHRYNIYQFISIYRYTLVDVLFYTCVSTYIYIYGLNSFTNTSNPPPVTFSSTNQKKTKPSPSHHHFLSLFWLCGFGNGFSQLPHCNVGKITIKPSNHHVYRW